MPGPFPPRGPHFAVNSARTDCSHDGDGFRQGASHKLFEASINDFVPDYDPASRRFLLGRVKDRTTLSSLEVILGKSGDCLLKSLESRAAVKLDDLVRFCPADAGRLADRLAPLGDPEAEGEFTSQEQAGYGVDPDLGAAPLEALSLSGSARCRRANDRENRGVLLNPCNQVRHMDTEGVGEEDKQPRAFGKRVDQTTDGLTW